MLTYHVAWLGARAKFKRGFRVETYEDLRADTAPALKRIVDFLGVPGVTMEEIEAVSARNQFEKMQQRESSGELKAKFSAQFSARDPNDPLGRRVRRGKVGAYADDMDAEDIAYCDALLAKFDYAAIVAEALRQQDRTS
jgi:hypothetical protein